MFWYKLKTDRPRNPDFQNVSPLVPIFDHPPSRMLHNCIRPSYAGDLAPSFIIRDSKIYAFVNVGLRDKNGLNQGMLL